MQISIGFPACCRIESCQTATLHRQDGKKEIGAFAIFLNLRDGSDKSIFYKS
jgi:hypothetical protein